MKSSIRSVDAPKRMRDQLAFYLEQFVTEAAWPTGVTNTSHGGSSVSVSNRTREPAPFGGTALLVPDGIEPLIGYRSWKVRDDVLTGISHPEPWPPGGATAEAICRGPQPKVEITYSYIPAKMRPSLEVELQAALDRWVESLGIIHEPPDEDCECGLYALNTLDAAMERHYADVIGKIEAWGKVVKGTKGIRAQYARVVELYVPSRGMDAWLVGSKPSAPWDLFIGDGHGIDVALTRRIGDIYGVPVIELHEWRRR